MRHREWNPKVFFRKISPTVIAQYEAAKGIVLLADRGEKADANQAYHAWQALPEGQRRHLETELLVVNDMTSTHARPYLDGAARRCWAGTSDESLIEESKNWSVNDLAMQLFLRVPLDLQLAHKNYAVDMLDHFREYRGRYAKEMKATPAAKSGMQQAFSEHFRLNGGGARCIVEDFEGDDKIAVFVLHEDDVKPFDQFRGEDAVAPVWMRLVNSLAAVFYPETCTLLVKAPRKPEREKLRDLWAEIIAGDPEYFEDLATSPKFNFAPLFDPNFNFPTHPADGLGQPCITRVVASSGTAEARKVGVDLAPNLSQRQLLTALAFHRTAADGSAVEGVRIQFEFGDATGRARYRTVSLYNPNSTNLRDTKRDRIIRRYLKEWGIDETRSAFSMAAPAVQAATRA